MSSAVAHAPTAAASRNTYSIGRVAVLGAGTMGARIAAHAANAGLPVLLLDMVPASGARNELGTRALAALKTGKPAAFASAAAAALVGVGNFDDDLPRLAECDWVIEAVAENLAIKRALLARVVPHLHPAAILTTNTSGLPVAEIAAELPAEVRRRWFGTHFFNPPRYMRLLELIRTPEADPEAVEAVSAFVDRRLGKSVVPANDVPNFIANRVGTFSMMNVLRIAREQGLSIEEVDLLTGEAIGWPKSGTYRLADMVGLDVLASVARNFAAGTSDERPDVTLDPVVGRLIESGRLGDKTAAGFYRKERGPGGKEVRAVLDPETLDYRPAGKPALPALDRAAKLASLPERVAGLLAGDPAQDKAANFYRRMLPELWAYAANRIGEVAASVVEIDRAMETGFNWQMGPFALWDAAGFTAGVEAMRAAGVPLPRAAETLLASGGTAWFRDGGAEFFDPASGPYKPVAREEGFATVAGFRKSNGVVRTGGGVSLVDLGDGIGCFALDGKMNALGEEAARFLGEQLAPGSESVRAFEGFVLATDAANFSAGADLSELLAAARDGAWDRIDSLVRRFQSMTQAVKFCPRPVVAAVAGAALGGGCELALHAAARQAHLELAMGLVEAGVGLVPAGGGVKEMLLRALAKAAQLKVDLRGDSAETLDAVRGAFETIAMARVSASALDARDLGLLAEADGLSMNRGRLLHDAKAQALRLAGAGYLAPAPRTAIPAPGANVFATFKLSVYLLREAEYISDHDAKIATHTARVLTGGEITPGTPVSEAHLLDLEREAFVSLAGEAKTVERIAAMLATGKPLRN